MIEWSILEKRSLFPGGIITVDGRSNRERYSLFGWDRWRAKKRKSLRKLDENGGLENGGKESVIAMTSREIPNTCFIFVRHSPLSLPRPPSSSSARKTGNLYFEAIKRECPWIHTYGPSVSKLITVPRQVRLVSLSKKFTPFPSFVLGDYGSGSIEPFDSKRVNACRHSVSVSIEARRNDLVGENRCPKKKYIYITRHRHR